MITPQLFLKNGNNLITISRVRFVIEKCYNSLMIYKQFHLLNLFYLTIHLYFITSCLNQFKLVRNDSKVVKTTFEVPYFVANNHTYVTQVFSHLIPTWTGYWITQLSANRWIRNFLLITLSFKSLTFHESWALNMAFHIQQPSKSNVKKKIMLSNNNFKL